MDIAVHADCTLGRRQPLPSKETVSYVFYSLSTVRGIRWSLGMVEKISSDYLVGPLARTGGKLRYSFKQPTKCQAAHRLSA